MNLLKWAKKKERRERQEIYERNKPFHDQIIQEIELHNAYAKSIRKKRILRFVGAFAGVVATFCCIFFPVYFSGGQTPQQTIPVYYSDNIKAKNISLEEWEAGSDIFSIKFGDNYEFEKIELLYDTVSHDNLYYHVSCQSDDMLKMVDVWIFCNPYYRADIFNFDVSKSIEVIVNNYSLYYLESYSLNNIIYSYSTDGIIEESGEMICFSYRETSFAQQSQFIQFVEELVHLKN